VILLPVVIGMVVRVKAQAFSARMGQPMKLFSALVLAAFTVLAIVKEWDALTAAFASLGPLVVAFNLISLLMGYYLSRWAGLNKPLATAISFEIGIHNSTLAIFVALSVLGNLQLALPAALYSVSMYLTATLFGMLVLRRTSST
jgi:BASS family bile acid:Na+ symporter